MNLAELRESMQKIAPGSVPLGSAPRAVHGQPAPQENALALTPVPSGIPSLDAAFLLGGLPAGRLSEIAGPSSSGKMGLAFQWLAQQTQAGKLVAWVDGRGEFYPPAAAAMGVSLSQLLLVQPRMRHSDSDLAMPLARAAEIIARSRAFSMVLIDMPSGQAMGHKAARRLRVAAQATGTTLIALGSKSGLVQGASARIEVSPCQELRCKSRRSQLRISKGGHGHGPFVELSSREHRFDHRPARAVAPILCRKRPGSEAPLAYLYAAKEEGSPKSNRTNPGAAHFTAANTTATNTGEQF